MCSEDYSTWHQHPISVDLLYKSSYSILTRGNRRKTEVIKTTTIKSNRIVSMTAVMQGHVLNAIFQNYTWLFINNSSLYFLILHLLLVFLTISRSTSVNICYSFHSSVRSKRLNLLTFLTIVNEIDPKQGNFIRMRNFVK